MANTGSANGGRRHYIKTPPHVLLFIPYLGQGGVARSNLCLAKGLSENGCRVTLAACSKQGNILGKEISALHGTIDVIVHSTNSWIKKKMPRVSSLWWLRGLFKKLQPDITIASREVTNMIAAMAHWSARAHSSLLLTEHTALSHEFEKFCPIERRILRNILPISYQYADKVIAVSDGVKSDLIRFFGISSSRVIRIYNPLSPEELLTKSSIITHHPWLKHKDSIVILGVGRLVPEKDFSTLIRAFAEIRSEIKAKLIILGDGPDRKDLENLAHSLHVAEHVSFPGYQANPFAYMHKCDVYVLSSTYEGFGLSLVEAMACGCPVVSTGCESGPGEILQRGRWGTLVPAADPVKMAYGIRKALTEKRGKAWARVHDFDARHVAGEYLRAGLENAPHKAAWRQ